MSSLFHANPCKLDPDTIVTQLVWSNVDPIAAVACNTVDDRDRETHQILFMNNEGALIPNSAISHDSEVTVLAWQPAGRVIAVGWADGMISCWLVDGRNRPTSIFSNNSQHNSSITILKWNVYGKRVITGDKKGLVCVWSVDARGSLTPTRQYRKKGEITSAVFCIMPNSSPAITQQTAQLSIQSLLSGQRKSDNKQTNSPAFFFGTDRGAVVYADDLGHCTDVQQLTASIDTMLFYEERSRLVIITRSLLLTQYQVAEDGRVSRVMQVKMSVAGDVAEKGLKCVVWASPGLLAAATHEKMVRLLDLAADESYNLSLSAVGDILDRSDHVVCLAFGPLDRYLAVGTHCGIVAVWKYNGPIRDVSGSRAAVTPTAASHWELHYKVTMSSPVHQLSWYGGQGTVAVVTDEGVTVLTESIMRCGMCGSLAVIQTDSHTVSIQITGSPTIWTENTDMLIQGLSVSASCFAVWNGKTARVYRVDVQMSSVEALEPFLCSARAMAIADASHITDEALFAAEQGMVKVLNFSGVQKGSISFTDAEGAPEHLDVNTCCLAVVTVKGVIQILDIKKPTRPVPIGSAGKFTALPVALPAEPGLITGVPTPVGNGSKGSPVSSSKTGQGLVGRGSNVPMANTVSLKVKEIRVNCKGNRVAILAAHVEGALQVRHRDSRLHVFDHNKGSIHTYDFKRDKRCPVSVFWDDTDERMLCCEAVKDRVTAPVSSKGVALSQGGEDKKKGEDTAVAEDGLSLAEVEVVIFFATTEHGLLMQDSFQRKSPHGPMIGFNVPRVSFRHLTTPSEDGAEGPGWAERVKIYSKVMRDFVGMDGVNEVTKKALLDFSYNLTLGKLDEAYRAVKTIGSVAIWENMAQMCVKTKRLDVAEVCLGNMGHARGAAAVRASRKEGSVELSIGILAVQLGLLDDAARLFKESGRFDYLNRLYQSAGIWNKAIKVAKSSDRIHLKTTHYQYAKHLESIGDVDRAIEHYERSETGRVEIPRMLFSLGKMDVLEDYVHKSSDDTLLKWWAAYLESVDKLDKAKRYYKKAGDHLALVRICCFQGDFSKAADIVSEAGDKASAYHFARQLEARGQFMEAINFYADAGCYNHSIRLTRAYNLDTELMRFALRAAPSLMIECATHFEGKGELEKAVQLFYKGGDLPRALDLCFRAGEIQKKLPPGGSKAAQAAASSSGVFDMMNTIVQDLGSDTSPQTLARCAEFLVNHKQFEKAIELYVMAKRYNQAVEMCLDHKVAINDDMVEQLTPPETVDPAERKEILKDLARALKKQGSFILASKKYTQAGDRIRAMKCLVRGGDTKAVIQFASISRNAEIYKLAANYLQQMNWRESADIMRAIIAFYTKAKSFEQLAGFYDSCAQVEIDDYRDYEKAIGALREALKYLVKAETRQATDMAEMTERRIGLMEQFVKARKALQREPAQMVEICLSLLKEPMLEEAIRAGDCLAMLVEHFHGAGRMQEAYEHLQDMEGRNIALHPYVDAQILEEVFNAVGASEGRKGGSKKTVDRDRERDREKEKEDDRERDSERGRDRGESKQGSSGDKGRTRSPSNVEDTNNDSDIEEDMDGDGDSASPRLKQQQQKQQQQQQQQQQQKQRQSQSQPERTKPPSSVPPLSSKSGGDGRRSSNRREEEEEELDEDIDEEIGEEDEDDAMDNRRRGQGQGRK